MRYISLLMGSCVCCCDESDAQGRTIQLAYTCMFFNINPRTSDAVRWLSVNPITGEVMVEFKNGYAYCYTNVSRRAIMNLMLNNNMSLGFWINTNCVNSHRAVVSASC